MKWINLLAIAMLVWGNAVFADLPAGNVMPSDQETISSWMADLNHSFPGLKVRPAADAKDEASAKQMLNELSALENSLFQYHQPIPAGSLKSVQCGRAICFGDGL